MGDASVEATVNWVMSVLILSLGAIFLVLPCWVRLWQWRSEHHIITKACLLLLIPDLVMILDFIPIHIRDLANGELVDDDYCKASSFLICACILASNVGNITVAYVTRRMLDPKDQKVTTKTLYVSAAIGWALGLLLASYFAGRDYLGSHRGVYCCTTQVRRGDIAGPVFFVYGVCITAMVYLYRVAYQQVASVVMPSSGGSRTGEVESSNGGSSTGASSQRVAPASGVKAAGVGRKPFPAVASMLSANKSSETREVEQMIATIADAQQQQQQQPPSAGAGHARSGPSVDSTASPTAAAQKSLRSPPSQTRAAPPVTSAAQSIARRAILMVLTYYACWSLISLNAVFELAGWEDRSLWWDVVAAWASKLQPSIDALILLISMTKVHEKREAMKQRNVESSQTAGRAVQLKVDSQLRAAASPRAAGNLVSPSNASVVKSRSRLVSNGAVSPRAPIVVTARPNSPIAYSALPVESPPPVESLPPVESPPPPEDSASDNPAAAAAGGNTVTHRRTVSSEVQQYQ